MKTSAETDVFDFSRVNHGGSQSRRFVTGMLSEFKTSLANKDPLFERKIRLFRKNWVYSQILGLTSASVGTGPNIRRLALFISADGQGNALSLADLQSN
jgi:hypothetical protein